MGFGAPSEPFVRFAFGLGATALGLTIALLLLILVLRALLVAATRRRQRLQALWRPLLTESLYAVPRDVPRLLRRDLPAFLELWNHLHESLRGDVKENLNQVARLNGAAGFVLKMLERAGFRERLVAVVSVGHLREPSAWKRVVHLLDDASPVLSLAAARALVQMDAPRAAPLLMPAVVSRTDWAPGKVVTILREAGTENVSQSLVQAILAAPTSTLPRLIRYLALAIPAQASEAVHQLLTTSREDQVISTCLLMVNDPRDLDLVRTLCTHPRWHVRVHAASALGRLGIPGDEKHLITLLGDTQWWVRYRAAQALAALPFLSLTDMERFRGEQADRYAADILGQVIAETRLAAGK